MAPTSPRLYFENAVGRVYGHPDNYVIIRFHPGPRQFSALQQLFTQVRRLLELNRWNRFVADQRLLAPYSPEDVAWAVAHWRDTAAQCPGGLYGAVVVAHDVFTRLAMGQVVQQLTGTAMRFRRFETEAEATAWLLQRA